MRIKNHFLWEDDNKQVPYHPTPNKGNIYNPKFIIVHYTAVTTAQSSINWFTRKEAKASAHLLIDRDGTVYQFAPFNVVTWHAGQSQWNGINGLNQHSIGIELVNAGRLMRSGTGWISSLDQKKIQDKDVIIARHKNESAESGWHEYTDIQLDTAMQIGGLLAAKYAIQDVLGHDEIAPFRKSDPGPAFPMASFRSRILGRWEDADDQYKTSTVVNIRTGPGTQYSPVSQALPKNTPVIILKREGTWAYVEVTNTVHGINDLEGWVHSKYIVMTQ